MVRVISLELDPTLLNPVLAKTSTQQKAVNGEDDTVRRRFYPSKRGIINEEITEKTPILLLRKGLS